jgi:hypothetical protein
LTNLDHPASAIKTDIASFAGLLSSADDTVQKALDTLDDNTDIVKYSVARMDVGSFTRSTTTATGTQAITGVGFQPTSIIFIANITSDEACSIGVDNLSATGSVGDLGNTTAGVWATLASVSILIRTGSGSTTNYVGTISSFDSDGFTVTWTKAASAVEGLTIVIKYLAFR